MSSQVMLSVKERRAIFVKCVGLTPVFRSNGMPLTCGDVRTRRSVPMPSLADRCSGGLGSDYFVESFDDLANFFGCSF
jgi:hypothetical protein